MGAAAERALELISAERREGVGTEGDYLDLLTKPVESTGRTQDLMLSKALPAVYERVWRPAWGRLFKGLTGPSMEDEVRIARLLLGLAPGHRVLDVACGPCNFTRAFARSVGPEGLAVGVDVSPTMLRQGARKAEREGLDNIALIRAGADVLPFADDSFDGVCCFAALYLFADPFAAIDEMTRTLAPGGRIALMTSVRRGATPVPLKPLVERLIALRLFERDEIVGRLERNGFTDVHLRVAGFAQFVGGRRAR
jgi:SAM-dependent methyltransferase